MAVVLTVYLQKERQKKCVTIELFHLDSSINPAAPPATPSTPSPYAGNSPTQRESAGLVFWGSAVLNLFEFIQAPARTVSINDIETPVYRSHNLVNQLELDVKRRDAHDYMKDVAPAKQQEREKYDRLQSPCLHLTSYLGLPNLLAKHQLKE